MSGKQGKPEKYTYMCENESKIARLTESDDSGMLNERVLLLVLENMNWDIQTVCSLSEVNTRLRAVAKRLLWRHLCLYRAPRMISTLTSADGGGSASRIIGGWPALAKLLFYCGGCTPSRHFGAAGQSPGHFVAATRFSKTSGRCFLLRRCRGDVLYVSDPCEHATGGGGGDDVGVYRGVFRSFMRSRTRECLIGRRAGFEERVRCPYCGARVWSMVEARMVPRRVTARRLGSRDDGMEYFVCLNGHLHGACWLVPLSSDDDGGEEEEGDDFDSSGDDDNYGPGRAEARNGGV